MYSMKSDLSSSNMIFPNSTQFRESCLSQEFPIPMPIMKYIWTNPSSPKVYQKLIQCCKIFFIKNPILVMKNLWYRYYDKKKWAYCNKPNCDRFCGNLKVINMDKIKDKIWVAKRFQIITEDDHSNVLAILPKLFRTEFEELDIRGWNLSFNELKLLSRGVEKCWFYSDVRYYNGESVPLENLIRIFSKNTKVCIHFWKNRQNSFCKSYDDFIEAANTVKEVYLRQIPDTFDISEFYRHLKMRKSHVIFEIVAENTLPRDPFDEVIDDILHTKSFEFVPPVINYFGINDDKLKKMRQIQEIEARKYSTK